MRAFLKEASRTALAVYLIHTHVGFVTKAKGPSMLPTFNIHGDVVICESLTPTFGRCTHGDVVVCTSPRDHNRLVVKRIVAMEGENVTFKRDRDGFWNDISRTITVPPGHVWVQGDNTSDSNDSRSYGPIPINLIKGRAWIKIWPYYDMQFIGKTMKFVGPTRVSSNGHSNK